ncbi:hypothetical protein GL213_05475 [Halogeometricum borinquense]|uniref:Halobacterial output domain-containing protein n=3 Tax=Halogeometricum borinquense TaxID=60847 RepID=E4NQJ5_HALBP|nr:hypothetical protein Hbor_10930 [Halogeometricum borinquense DSM 11551]ELY30192.1 hypothetical protein C499_02963 [Halogeometricum borinquense DSM 11551]QIB76486.1 hypothetical protein G3I44_12375 [Halogeometricum borinquense]QIQ77720.1 hypothetical protein GL213_05475 [Halogeometricum borinquense]RYJ15422.1 hypothetical protein ELS19_11575 [Halogeometricum borinquense]
MLPASIVSLVAELENVGVTEIPPLASAIDPDALVTLFDKPNASPSVLEFDYAGYRIVIKGDGNVHALEASPVELCNAD